VQGKYFCILNVNMNLNNKIAIFSKKNTNFFVNSLIERVNINNIRSYKYKY